jgi:hypothetical protein
MNLTVDYDPALVEEALLRRLRGDPQEKAFHRERDRLYELTDPEPRERAFRALHAEWFVRLRLEQPLAVALAEQPLIARRADRCVCRRAGRCSSEGAELFVNGSDVGPRRVVRIALCPDTLLGEPALPFLRHELQHIADMLDPAFAYDPTVPSSPRGPLRDRLIAERYRVAWDACIDGRLVRGGRLAAAARAARWAEFAPLFAGLGAQTATTFAALFDGPAVWTHPELMALARAEDAASRAGGRCGLCGCPTYTFCPSLDAATHRLIATDFPMWRPGDGVCLQCADRYSRPRRSRRKSSLIPVIPLSRLER